MQKDHEAPALAELGSFRVLTGLPGIPADDDLVLCWN